jgi:hypothetical protein
VKKNHGLQPDAPLEVRYSMVDVISVRNSHYTKLRISVLPISKLLFVTSKTEWLEQLDIFMTIVCLSENLLL